MTEVSLGLILQVLTVFITAVVGYYVRKTDKRISSVEQEVDKNAKARRFLFGESLNGDSTSGFREKVVDQLEEAREERTEAHKGTRKALQHIKERLDEIESELEDEDNVRAEFKGSSTSWPWVNS